MNLNPRPYCFTDRKGRTWDLSLDLFIAARIDSSDFSRYLKDSEPFSILRLDKAILHKLFLSDAPLLFAVIWAIVIDQAQVKYERRQQGGDIFPLSPKEDPEGAEGEFVSGINGPVIEAARKAFGEAISDFFPELRIVLSTLHDQAAMARKKVESRLTEIVPKMEGQIDRYLDKAFAKLETSLENLPDDLHGETSIP